MEYQIIQGDNRATLKTIPDNSIDAIVTDPPYGIDFLGKAWDANTGALETYQECLRVLKPGGHILAFSAARTYHHLAVTLEQAGFEIRDQIMWIYSSGFPKSQDIGRSIQRSLGVKQTRKVKDDGSKSKHYDYGMKKSDENEMVVVTDTVAKQWEGWGTSLKPAHEPIALAQKPMKGNIRDNCQKYGTGALNIDASRVEREGFEARFPSNVLGEILQADYQKYFYCPKVSRKERHIGYDLDQVPTTEGGMWDTDGSGVQYNAQKVQDKGNNHPTVKPVELMKYLIKLITPPGGTVLDPFNGSGSTGCAAVELGFNYIGCELDPNYVEISLKRIEAWTKQDNKFEELFV